MTLSNSKIVMHFALQFSNSWSVLHRILLDWLISAVSHMDSVCYSEHR